MLEAYPNLGIIWFKKMLTPYYKVYDQNNTSTVQTTLDKFLQKNKML